MSKFLLFICVFLKTYSIEPGLNHNELVIWNVGQGLWVTYISLGVCHHFDMGGDKTKAKLFMKNLKVHCQDKVNFAYFSHWDWDHINLSRMAKTNLPNLCIQANPQGLSSERKKFFLSGINQCPANSLSPEIAELKVNMNPRNRPNQMSRTYILNNEILLPGDSPMDMEKKWREQISTRNKIRILVLGHHGSRTSTSPMTLKILPHLTASIASSNPQRYGHPHTLTLQRLKKAHVPAIKTVSWNSLHFLLTGPRLRPGLTTKH